MIELQRLRGLSSVFVAQYLSKHLRSTTFLVSSKRTPSPPNMEMCIRLRSLLTMFLIRRSSLITVSKEMVLHLSVPSVISLSTLTASQMPKSSSLQSRRDGSVEPALVSIKFWVNLDLAYRGTLPH